MHQAVPSHQANSRIRDASPGLHKILTSDVQLNECRERLLDYCDSKLRFYLSDECEMHPLEIVQSRETIIAFRNVLSKRYERSLNYSALDTLRRSLNGSSEVSSYFLEDFHHLFKAIEGESSIYVWEKRKFLDMEGREAAIERSDFLDETWSQAWDQIQRYKSGLDEDVIERRNENKRRILRHFGGGDKDWYNWRWQTAHIIKDSDTLGALIEISSETREAIDLVTKAQIPFGITPYYASLMDHELGSPYDAAVRAQVIPPIGYAREMVKHRTDRHEKLDFMEEGDSSPIDLVTRRYPSIAILKPINTCPQICVYCQRNWEIEDVMSPHALATSQKLRAAIEWFESHPAMREVLITGGDPGIMSDDSLKNILDQLAKMPHVERIRIGTRTPVTLPMRITDGFVEMLAKHHAPGKRIVCIVTHVEHPYEVTPELMEAVQKFRRVGFKVYNQQVFTTFNSRLFETVALRRSLVMVGIEPYYTFFPKGKKEAKEYLVPVARILQERKEEARFVPGTWRTDEPVFNVPRLGKNHLRAWQDHSVISIRPNGARVYEFHPWEKNLNLVDPYIHEDRAIGDYLNDLELKGENPEDYISIWYYY